MPPLGANALCRTLPEGHALQGPCLKAWGSNAANVETAQKAFIVKNVTVLLTMVNTTLTWKMQPS